MSSLYRLAEKLSEIADNIGKDSDELTLSEFTFNENEFLQNSIRMFVAKLEQFPSDYTLTCTDVILNLNFKSHPEGGFYQRFSWTKQQTRTFFLLPSGCVSSWHRLNGIAETWKWLFGGTLIVPQISNDSRWLGETYLTEDKDVVILNECNGTEKWGNWFGAYHNDDDFSLAICECTPPFEFTKFELANDRHAQQFVESNPTRTAIIDRLTIKSNISETIKQ